VILPLSSIVPIYAVDAPVAVVTAEYEMENPMLEATTLGVTSLTPGTAAATSNGATTSDSSVPL